MNLGHEKALAEMMQLNEIGVRLVLKEMLKAGKIAFPLLAQEYVQYLESGNTEKNATISTLSLHLGLVAGSDKSPFAQQSRKYLYEKGLYTGNDGSIFGKQLEDEFGNQQK
jgi:hypothetical protein